MSIDKEMEKLKRSLSWMEEKVGVNWSSSDSADMNRIHGWSIEARGHLAVVAEDTGDEATATDLGAAFLKTNTDWSAGHPAAWYARMKYLVNAALDLAKKAVGAKARHHSPSLREEYAGRAYDSLIPEIDRFTSTPDVLTVVGESKAMRLWARAHSIAAWSQRGINPERAFSIMRKLADHLPGCRSAQSEIRVAAAFALQSVIESEPSQDDALELWTLAEAMFTPDTDALGTQTWFLLAAAVLGSLSDYLPDTEQRSAIKRMRLLVSLWNHECWQDKNCAYAIDRVVQSMIGHAEALESEQLDPIDQSLLVALMKQSDQAVIKITGMDYFVHALPTLLDPDALADVCIALVRVFPSLTQGEEQVRVLYALRFIARQAGGKALESAWESICQSGPVEQIFWLFHVNMELKQETNYEISPIDSTGLERVFRSWEKGVTEELKMQWLQAILLIASHELLAKDTGQLETQLNTYQDDDELARLTWLVNMIMVSLSPASHTQLCDWCGRVSDVSESESGLLLTFLKMSALSVLLGRLKHFDEKMENWLQSEIDRLKGLMTGDVWIREILDEAAQYIALRWFSEWYGSRVDASVDQSYTLLRQLIGLEYGFPGSTTNLLLKMTHWLLRHPEKTDERVLSDIALIHQFRPPVMNNVVDSDFVTFQFLGLRDEQLMVRLLQEAQTSNSSLWSSLSGDHRDQFLEKIRSELGDHSQADEDIEIVCSKLPWYLAGGELVRVSAPEWINARLYFIGDGNTYHRLEGGSGPIHGFNSEAKLQLSDEHVLDYLRFFTFFLRVDGVPFYIVESSDDVMLPANLNDDDRRIIREQAKPAILHGLNSSGGYLCEATIYYENQLFNAEFLVSSSGLIEMLNEQLLADLSGTLDHPLVLNSEHDRSSSVERGQ